MWERSDAAIATWGRSDAAIAAQEFANLSAKKCTECAVLHSK